MGALHKEGLDLCITSGEGLTFITAYLALANSADDRGDDHALSYAKQTMNDIEEPSSGGYSRLAITFGPIQDASLPTGNGRVVKNTTQVQFSFNGPVISGTGDGGSSGEVTHYVICDGASGDSNIVGSGRLQNAPITPGDGVTITFAVGQIELGVKTD